MSDKESYIPIVDLAPLGGEGKGQGEVTEAMRQVAEQLGRAFRTVGFVYLKNHGVNQDQIDGVNAIMRQFFELPVSTKTNYKRLGDDNHGYVGVEVESLDPKSPGDLKEAFNVSPAAAKVWPEEEVPGIKKTLLEAHSACYRLIITVLRLMAIDLELEDPETFIKSHPAVDMEAAVDMNTMRCLYYPPIPESWEVKAGQLRCGEHSDYGSVTLLFQDSKGGLQVRRRDGEWVDASPIEGTAIVNIGDLMQRWSSDTLVSTKHRVVIPASEMASRRQVRQSLAFFGHPSDEAVIRPLDGSNKYPPITGLGYLKMRFSETY